MSAAQLGLVPVEAGSAWFDQYVKAYVTAGDYLADALAAAGVPFDPVPLISLRHPALSAVMAGEFPAFH